MKPPIETIRLSEHTKEKLINLKKVTGIEHWNILSRLAFCTSLAESDIQQIVSNSTNSNIEMTWSTFSGKFDYVFSAVLKYLAKKHNCTPESILCSHIERGANILSNTKNKHFF